MRCHEARQRLKELRGLISNQNPDLELRGHLKVCAACDSVARSERALDRDFRALAADEISDDLPLSILRTRVEARMASTGTRQKENSLMSFFTSQLKRRPRLSVTIGAVMVVLLVATLVPFKFDQTVGYQVALAGVDRDLAMDSGKIDRLLKELGIQNAVANVSDCQATCRLTISDLDSEHDVKVIKAAFDELGNCVLENVQEIPGEESNTMFGLAKHNIFSSHSAADDNSDEIEIKAFVLKRLEALSGDSCQFSIWVQKGEGDDSDVTIDVTALGGDAIFFADSLMGPPGCTADSTSTMIMIDQSDTGGQMTITDKDGNVQTFDLNDPEAVARIKEMGFDLNMFEMLGDSTGAQVICKTVEVVSECDSLSQDSVAKESGEPELPEGYSLGQNYPNPFNPTTTISYRLPEAQQVTLEIYNINGRKVTTLVDGQQSAGEHLVEWNATDDNDAPVGSGVYFYRLTAGDFSASKKMSLVK